MCFLVPLKQKNLFFLKCLSVFKADRSSRNIKDTLLFDKNLPKVPISN